MVTVETEIQPHLLVAVWGKRAICTSPWWTRWWENHPLVAKTLWLAWVQLTGIPALTRFLCHFPVYNRNKRGRILIVWVNHSLEFGFIFRIHLHFSVTAKASIFRELVQHSLADFYVSIELVVLLQPLESSQDNQLPYSEVIGHSHSERITQITPPMPWDEASHIT